MATAPPTRDAENTGGPLEWRSYPTPGVPRPEGRIPAVREFTLETERRTHVVDVTRQVRDCVDGGEAAAVVVFVPHTTGGVVVQEHAGSDPDVARDLEMALERVVEDGWPWKHFEPGNVNPGRTRGLRSPQPRS